MHRDTLFTINTKLDEMPRGREALQLWARLQLAAYSLNITNMSSDWRSGEAFCAIIHRYRQDISPFPFKQFPKHYMIFLQT